jgi:hypothetical protein
LIEAILSTRAHRLDLEREAPALVCKLVSIRVFQQLDHGLIAGEKRNCWYSTPAVTRVAEAQEAETISVGVNLRRRFRTGLADVGTTRWLLRRLDLKKERNMSSALRRSTMLLAIAITAPLISGCVGWRDEVAMAQSTANQALATAQSAQSAAGAAQQRADQAQQTAQLAQSSAQAATSVAAAAQASSAAAQASASAAQQAANQATATVAAAAIERAQFAQARGPRG